MKICKVEINKNFNGNMCRNDYPAGYNAKDIGVLIYSEYDLDVGDNVGYCIGIVPDNWSFNSKMVEVTKETATTDIEDWCSHIEDETERQARIDKIVGILPGE